MKLTDEDTGESFTYKIVGEDEANVKEKKISLSPGTLSWMGISERVMRSPG